MVIAMLFCLNAKRFKINPSRISQKSSREQLLFTDKVNWNNVNYVVIDQRIAG